MYVMVCNPEWSTEACQTAVSKDVVNCTCNHLTNFAVLVVSIFLYAKSNAVPGMC